MDPRITQVTEYLDKIALKLGLGASEIWPWLIRQQYVEVLPFLAFGIPAICLGAFLLLRLRVVNQQHEAGEITKNEKDSLECFFGFLGAVATFAGVGLFLKGTIEAFDLLNVEYAALVDLIKMVK